MIVDICVYVEKSFAHYENCILFGLPEKDKKRKNIRSKQPHRSSLFLRNSCLYVCVSRNWISQSSRTACCTEGRAVTSFSSLLLASICVLRAGAKLIESKLAVFFFCSTCSFRRPETAVLYIKLHKVSPYVFVVKRQRKSGFRTV